MATNVQVDPLAVTFCPLVPTPCSVEQLYLNQKNGSLDLDDLGRAIDDKDIIELANILVQDHSIKNLCIRNGNFSIAAMQILCAAIKSSTTVRQLDLVKNNLGQKFAQTIADLLVHNKSLTFINLSVNPFGLEGGLIILESLRFNTTLGGIYLFLSDPFIALSLNARLITILKEKNRSLQLADILGSGVFCFRGPAPDSPEPYLERNGILNEIKKAFPNTPTRLLSKEAEHKEKKETIKHHLQPDKKEDAELIKFKSLDEKIRNFARQYPKRSEMIDSLYVELKFAYLSRQIDLKRETATISPSVDAPLLLSLESLSLKDPTSFVGILEGESPPLYKLVHHQNQQGKF